MNYIRDREESIRRTSSYKTAELPWLSTSSRLIKVLHLKRLIKVKHLTMSLKRKLEFPTNYIAKRDGKHINYDFLITNILKDKGSAITWLQEKKTDR